VSVLGLWWSATCRKHEVCDHESDCQRDAVFTTDSELSDPANYRDNSYADEQISELGSKVISRHAFILPQQNGHENLVERPSTVGQSGNVGGGCWTLPCPAAG
jgi:hypothetical protein